MANFWCNVWTSAPKDSKHGYHTCSWLNRSNVTFIFKRQTKWSKKEEHTVYKVICAVFFIFFSPFYTSTLTNGLACLEFTHTQI